MVMNGHRIKGKLAAWRIFFGLTLCFSLLGLSCEKSPNGPDGKSQWAAVNEGLESQHIQILAMHPDNANLIFAGTWDGLYRSSNAGGYWARVDSGWAYTHVTAISLNALDPEIMYVGTMGAGVFKSEDRGLSWQAKNIGLDNRTVYGVAVNPNHPDTLYVGTDDGIYLSEDGADSWSKVYWYNRAFLAIDSQDDENIYAGGMFGNFHKSVDGGASWVESSNGLQLGGPSTRILWVLVDPGNPRNLYACSNITGIYKSTNFALLWVPANNGLGGVRDVRAIVLDSTNPDLLHCATANGVYRSTDAAETWEKMNEGLANLDVRAMAYQRTRSFYVGTWGDGVFKWQP